MAEWQDLISDEHFTVDGTPIEAWALLKSFVKKDGSSRPPGDGGRNPTVDFKGEKRSNEMHQSTTDPQARLCKNVRCLQSDAHGDDYWLAFVGCIGRKSAR